MCTHFLLVAKQGCWGDFGSGFPGVWGLSEDTLEPQTPPDFVVLGILLSRACVVSVTWVAALAGPSSWNRCRLKLGGAGMAGGELGPSFRTKDFPPFF